MEKQEGNDSDKQMKKSPIYGTRGYVFMNPLDEDEIMYMYGKTNTRYRCSSCPLRGICG
ncbi:MAG: hypothetical protein QXP02_05955 [Desulfurococcaceae archaeon]